MIEWEEHIATLQKLTVPSTKEEVKKALIEAVKKRIPKEKFGLFLSGGLDSNIIALILKKFTDNFTCYCVGIKGSKDMEAAEKIAKELGLNLKKREYSIEEVEEPLKKAAQILKTNHCVEIEIASVIIAAAELAKKDKIRVFFGGLGSEEIFAGYERHEKAKNVNEECWRGLKEMWKRDIKRDEMIEKALGIKMLTPFLDDDLIKKAMGIPGERKVNLEHRKIILSEIAEELGLSH